MKFCSSPGVRAFSQRSLSREVFDNLCRRLAADEGREFFNAGSCDLLNRTELPQQARLSFLAHAGNRRQFGSEIAQLAALAMISDRVAMCLVADHLNQPQDLRMRIEIDRFILT